MQLLVWCILKYEMNATFWMNLIYSKLFWCKKQVLFTINDETRSCAPKSEKNPLNLTKSACTGATI
jgi:hypothetical protein